MSGQRIKGQWGVKSGTSRHQFYIDRWRLADGTHESHPSGKTSQHTSVHTVYDQQPPVTPRAGRIEASYRETTGAAYELVPDFDNAISSDHVLLHLISHNVCRGFMSNKTVLKLTATYIDVFEKPSVTPDITPLCGVAVVRLTHLSIPACLRPTQLQMNSPHPTWMDMFPFPEMRDHLIQWQDMFSHKSFLWDIFGDLPFLEQPRKRSWGDFRLPPRSPREVNNTATHIRNGLVLWGEPHLKESWEVTPHFLKKWAWVFEGCREIVDISNKWRTARGEQILPTCGYLSQPAI